jgi:hypothetical protein
MAGATKSLRHSVVDQTIWERKLEGYGDGVRVETTQSGRLLEETVGRAAHESAAAGGEKAWRVGVLLLAHQLLLTGLRGLRST